MYNLAAMRAANVALWDALASLLRQGGVAGVPSTLLPDDAPMPDTIGADVLFTQACGYPLQTINRGQYAVIGVPDYDAPGGLAPEISGPAHRAFFVVRDDDPAVRLEDLRSRVFACNSRHSNSGMNLPRRTLAPLAEGRPFFRRVALTGSHAASMASVRTGDTDAAAIDSVTYAFHADHRPQALRGLRILAPTVPSPTLPFITSAATSPAVLATLRAALHEVGTADRYAEARQRLRLRSIEAPDAADYSLLIRYEQDAAALGYPALT